MIDRIGNQLAVQQAALGVLAFRQELLASNMANADTPNFKARDIDFKGALEAAVTRRGGVQLSKSSVRHLPGAADSVYAAAIKYRAEFQPGVDGNTVNMDIERSAFAENALRLEAALTFIRGEFKDLQLAMSQ